MAQPDHPTVEGFQPTVAQTWRRVSTNFWFLPTVLTLAALVIAPTLVQLDERLQAAGRSLDWLNWVYGGGLPGARRLLSAIATAMMAIATVMFSSQTTALTFIGQEYGSWLLRNFLGDSRNQLAFGAYISTFVYALMVLRTIHKEPDGAPVPHLALSFAIFLAMAGLGVLIYSMYHTSRFLQSSTIINYAAKDLTDTIRRLTMPSGEQASPSAEWLPLDGSGIPVPAPADGYVQYGKERRLIKLCRAEPGPYRSEPASRRFRHGGHAARGSLRSAGSGRLARGANGLRHRARAATQHRAGPSVRLQSTRPSRAPRRLHGPQRYLDGKHVRRSDGSSVVSARAARASSRGALR